MTRRSRVAVLAAACLVSATIALVQFQQRSPRQQSPSLDAQPQLAVVEQAAPKTPAPRPAVRKTAAVAKARPASSTTLPVPKSDVTTVVTAPAPRDSAPNEASAPLQIVTISGCLEQDDERFQLKDTSGDGAPKGRSWRSGFLRRSASTIDVVDQTDRLHLPTYVGQRVSMTGTLVDREMQVRSVSIVAESCQEKSA